MPLSDWISLDSYSGDPLRVGAVTITPFIQNLDIRFPGINGGLVWSRPSSVLVQSGDGREEVISVVDITRIIQFSLLGFSLLSGLLMWRRSRR